ncbi:MAG: hypothetical protein ACLPT4_04215 [Verrucomicrobiia bacterium]
MKHKSLLVRTFLCSLSALATGCSDLTITVRPTDLPTGDKLPLHAVLVQDPANFTASIYQLPNGFVYSFGRFLADYEQHVVSASFQQVDYTASLEKAFSNTSADIVLIPRFVKVEKSLGLYMWDTNSFTMVMEWTAKDRASQDTVWLKTITANASKKMGDDALHPGPLVQKLFDDLNIKTLEAFQKAPELRRNAH